MSAEKFSIESEIVYTLKSAHGVQEFKGWQKFNEHGENLLGAFVDRLTGENTGNLSKDKLRNFDFILKHRKELETIFAIQDQIAYLQPRPAPIHCDGNNCNCPDCYADEDF